MSSPYVYGMYCIHVQYILGVVGRWSRLVKLRDETSLVSVSSRLVSSSGEISNTIYLQNGQIASYKDEQDIYILYVLYFFSPYKEPLPLLRPLIR